jgi:uncharacterized protein
MANIGYLHTTDGPQQHRLQPHADGTPVRLNPTELMLSGYVHDHRVAEDMVGLYHPFGHEVAFVSNAILDHLKTNRFDLLPPRIFSDLVDRRFLVLHGHDERALQEYIVPPLRGFVSLWLLAVQTCNMGCKYCVVDAEEQTRRLPMLPTYSNVPKGMMTPQVADAALEYFEKNLRFHRPPEARVTLYGGEAMLNRTLLFHAIPRAREITWENARAPLTIMVFTNGLQYDPEITELYKKYNVTVGISIDGTKKHHDAARVNLSGKGTFDKVVESYHKYREAGLSMGVSCTIGKHNSDELSEIADYFINVLKVPAAQFQTPILMPDDKNKYYVQMADAADSAMAAYKRFRDAGIDEGLAMRRISMFVDRKFNRRDCLAVGGELAVTPDGTMGPCHNATVAPNSPFKGSILDANADPESQGNFIEWHARMPLNMPGCHGCSFIGLCGGGCPLNAQLSTGTIWEKDPHQCGYMEKFVNWLLEDIWLRHNSAAAGQ